MKSFDALCEDIAAFARANPDERAAVMSDSAVYGEGMDALAAVIKMQALSAYAADWKLTLYIENRADDRIRARVTGQKTGGDR